MLEILRRHYGLETAMTRGLRVNAQRELSLAHQDRHSLIREVQRLKKAQQTTSR